MRLTEIKVAAYDEYGHIQEETIVDINSSSRISEITHFTDGEVDVEGVIVGIPTQEKFDQFFNLANTTIANDQSEQLLLPEDQVGAARDNASELLSSMNVSLTENVSDELDNWFNEAEAIRLQAYQWNSTDKTLQNLWVNGNDNTLAAYDLQSVMESHQAEWDASIGAWNYNNSLPAFETPQYPPQYPPQFSTDTLSNFEYSLSDFDLGLEHSELANADYGYPGWWGDGGSPSSDGSDSAFSMGSNSWSNSYIDPLVLKLGGGAVHTTNLQGSTVMFDMAANGKKVRAGWITPDHAFLVRDRNRNGVIDDSSEMFSERTSLTAATGFATSSIVTGKQIGRAHV